MATRTWPNFTKAAWTPPSSCAAARPPTLSAILVKPDGARTLVNYQQELPQLAANAVDLAANPAGALLFDGYQPALAIPLLA